MGANQNMRKLLSTDLVNTKVIYPLDSHIPEIREPPVSLVVSRSHLTIH